LANSILSLEARPNVGVGLQKRVVSQRTYE